MDDRNINNEAGSFPPTKVTSPVGAEESKKNISDNVKFNDEPLISNNIEKRKRRWDEGKMEKLKAAEEYNRQVEEQQYKRLMHLLSQSKFYSSYILKKIDQPLREGKSKSPKKGRKNTEPNDENKHPEEGRNKSPMISKNQLSGVVKQKLSKQKNKMNLSQEEIEEQLNKDCKDEPVDSSIKSSDTTLKYFDGSLRDYQIEGLQWLKVLYENGINGILADEMGLGKTVQVIALFCHLIEKRQSGPYLIIAPLSTIPNWMLEFERFAPKLPVFILHGPKDDRFDAINKIIKKYPITKGYETHPIVLTTYEILLYEKYFFKSQNWRYMVVDEGHRIKNQNCMLIKFLKSCKSMNRLILTGTPLQNNLAELWSLLNFLLPELFDDLAVFESWFDAKQIVEAEGAKKLLKQEQEKHILMSLREILRPFMLRREKTSVCLDIPAKKELLVYAPLTELQHTLYKAVLNYDLERLCKIEESPLILSDDGSRPKRKCVLKKLSDTNSSKSNNTNESEDNVPMHHYGQVSDDSTDSMDVNWKQTNSPNEMHLSLWKNFKDISERNLHYLIRLKFGNRGMLYKKIVNHPYLVQCPLDSTGLPRIDEDLVKCSGKLLVLDAMLEKLKKRGHKVLLFSTLTSILDVIEDYLSLRDYQYLRLDGTTKIEQRAQDIKNFNLDPNIFLFLISTRAGGVGLNLIGADTVIMYDSDWNPQVDLQAMARCHRIGQKRPVVVYRLCAKGTIDEKIMKRADTKRILEKMVISRKVDSLGFNVKTKETLLELQKFLESTECEIVKAENQVFTEAELEKLLDRTDLMDIKTKK